MIIDKNCQVVTVTILKHIIITMSDESISKGEDKANLEYIAQRIHVKELSFFDESVCNRLSALSEEGSDIVLERIGSDAAQYLSKYSKLGPHVLNDPVILNFKFKWSFGLNSKVRIKNLSDKEKHQFLFAADHFPIVYDILKNSMNHLEGHFNAIKDLTCSSTGRWIVTVDCSTSGNIMFWENREDGLYLIYTIFEPYPHDGIEILEISGSARYLITIGSTNDAHYSVDFWNWLKGEVEPDDSYKVPDTYGKPVRICFNPDIEEHIMLVFEHNIFLMIWDEENKKLSNVVIPQLLHKGKIGQFTDGTYLSKCHECYTSTTTGCISVFGNTLYPRPFEESELDNSKIFRNSVKVSNGSIQCCTTTEGLIVTADINGDIQFFDRKIRILYWLRNFNLGPILSISFSLVSQLEYEGENHYVIRKPVIETFYSEGFEDITEELAILSKKVLPETATLSREPFYVRNFLVSTVSSNVYMIDCVSNKCVPVFQIDAGMVTAIETHDELDYLVIGYDTGAIILIDINTNTLISRAVLSEVDKGKNAVTCIKYSIESLDLVCGRENGEIWILQPTLLTPIAKPFTVTNYKVMKIDFSFSPKQFAYYDDNWTVVLFNYNVDTSMWDLAGKIKSHYDDINDIMFVSGSPHSKLYTISNDRHIVEYNNGTLSDGNFEIVSRDRIDQSAVPICFTFLYEILEEKHRVYILVSNSKYKMKLLYQSTKIPKTLVLGPAYGCFKDDYIRKMSILPNSESRYMVFATHKQLGLHILPPDGNPYKFIGYLAHPGGLKDFKLTRDGKYVLSFSSDHEYVFKWEILPRGVELMHVLGGKELEPFYCLIEGGAYGTLFQEIKDLFYYMQIFEQEDTDMPRKVLDTISINEIPDLVRSCGFFPSEFELENMMIDIRYRNFDDTQQTNEEISFIDFTKLYCNHKPAYGYSLEEVKDAYNFLAGNGIYDMDDEDLPRDELINILTTEGEPMSIHSVLTCFKTLLRYDSENENFEFLPEEISFDYFKEELLGIDMTRDKFHESGGSETSFDTSCNDI